METATRVVPLALLVDLLIVMRRVFIRFIYRPIHNHFFVVENLENVFIPAAKQATNRATKCKLWGLNHFLTFGQVLFEFDGRYKKNSLHCLIH